MSCQETSTTNTKCFYSKVDCSSTPPYGLQFVLSNPRTKPQHGALIRGLAEPPEACTLRLGTSHRRRQEIDPDPGQGRRFVKPGQTTPRGPIGALEGAAFRLSYLPSPLPSDGRADSSRETPQRRTVSGYGSTASDRCPPRARLVDRTGRPPLKLPARFWGSVAPGPPRSADSSGDGSPPNAEAPQNRTPRSCGMPSFGRPTGRRAPLYVHGPGRGGG
jgi:hypothetical protein